VRVPTIYAATELLVKVVEEEHAHGMAALRGVPPAVNRQAQTRVMEILRILGLAHLETVALGLLRKIIVTLTKQEAVAKDRSLLNFKDFK
jgi:hypothetical protein